MPKALLHGFVYTPTIPEPSSFVLLGTATFFLAGFFGWQRRKQPVPA
jgi:hypothetical protein